MKAQTIKINYGMVIAHAKAEALNYDPMYADDARGEQSFAFGGTASRLAHVLNGDGKMRQFYRKQIINWLPNLQCH